MAKVTGPLLSLGAAGTIAGTQTYAKWKGRPYVRQRVTPANPNTTAQQTERGSFAWLQQVWKLSDTLMQEPWNLYATGQVMTGRNAWTKINQKAFFGETDNDAMLFSPGAKGGLPVANAAATPGSNQLSIAITAPTLPAGWTIVQGVAAAMRQQDPHAGALYTVTAGFDATSTYAVVLTGLTPSEVYVWGAWFEYEKPDGSAAYSAAFMGTATPTA